MLVLLAHNSVDVKDNIFEIKHEILKFTLKMFSTIVIYKSYKSLTVDCHSYVTYTSADCL